MYTDTGTAASLLSSSNGYRLVHAAAGWSNGLSYACHPEYGDVVAALNAGLAAFKATEAYAALCARYPGITCDPGTRYANVKTAARLEIADHPPRRADIVFGTEADFGEHNYVRDGVLGGFDLELTRALCDRMGRSCAVVTVPWQAVQATNYSRFGWARNPKTYPGEGVLDRWFHCSLGAFNTAARQQSLAFTAPYTAAVAAGFVIPDAGAAAFPADAAGRAVAVVRGWASCQHFEARVGAEFRPRQVLRVSGQAAVWEALTSGAADAVYVDETAARAWLARTPGYRLVNMTSGWARGVAYACHPQYGDVVAALNGALAAFKSTRQFVALCERFSSVACDAAGATFANVKTPARPEIADHPPRRADIVFGTEADFGEYNYVRDGVLGGFDLELTRALCDRMGRSCAVVTVPWQAAWTTDYSRFGWPSNTRNYAGEGYQNRWFHCTTGTFNIIERQQSIAFTHPYTDPGSARAGFVVPAEHASTFPADASGKAVGLLQGWAAATYFLTKIETFRFVPLTTVQFTALSDLWTALTRRRIEVWIAILYLLSHRFSPCMVLWGLVWCGVVWCCGVWCGVVWCGVVWCGVVWCGVVWCGVVWCGRVGRGGVGRGGVGRCGAGRGRAVGWGGVPPKS